MKKFSKTLALALVLIMALCVVSALAETAEAPDTYTSASATKIAVTGDAVADAAAVLEAQSSLLLTKAETEAEGYVAKEGTTYAQILTTNPDGSVGLSTIGEWKYTAGGDYGLGTVIIRLAYGQNDANLREEGAGGTLLVAANKGYYLLHLLVTNIETLEYSDEAYAAGAFAPSYSGASAHLSQDDITAAVTMIEQTYALIL